MPYNFVYYRPQTKLGEGNVLHVSVILPPVGRVVSLSVRSDVLSRGGMMSLPVWSHVLGRGVS